MKSRKRTLLTVLITFLLTLFLIGASVFAILLNYDIPFEKLMKVMRVIKTSYVGEYDLDKCEENAINAVLQSIDDKYAVYYDEENAKKTMQMIEGYYIGIGVEVFANTQKGYMEVISAYEDSPADRAGVKSGDLIKMIDGREYTASQMADAVNYMKGIDVDKALEKTMSITLLRDNDEITVNLKREKIDMYKVDSRIIDNICYIRYSGFTAESQKAFRNIIKGLDNKIQGIVVDVRNNPGGEFSSAIEMCDLFLDDEMIIYTVDKNGEKTSYMGEKGSSKLPLAVLVNSQTASAAEIFAGSMQSNKRAVIIGEKTYGKGVSQTVQYLNPLDKSEGALKLTTCKNYTPSGRWIDEAIIPDIEIKTEEIEDDITYDAAFIAAVNSLKEDK